MLTDAQKTLFAERYLKDQQDVLMIVAGILGPQECERNPLQVINLKNSLPYDEFVLAELERLKSVTLTKEDFLRELHQSARQMFAGGESGEYVKSMRLYAEVNGFIIKKEAKNDGKSDDRLDELAAMVVDG